MLNVNLIRNKNFYRVKQLKAVDTVLSAYEKPLNGGKLLSDRSATNIEDLRINFAVLLKTLNKKYIAQIPVNKSPEKVMNELLDVVKTLRDGLKKSYDGIVGFVTGGHEYDINLPYADNSCNLLDKIVKTLKDENVPHTVLAEQKNIGMGQGINFYAYRNNADIYDGIISDIKGNPVSKDEIQKTAEKLFDYVEISKEVPVLFKEDILM